MILARVSRTIGLIFNFSPVFILSSFLYFYRPVSPTRLVEVPLGRFGYFGKMSGINFGELLYFHV